MLIDESFILMITIINVLIIAVCLIIIEIKSKPKINELSYQKFAKFLGDTELKDKDFKTKVNKISKLILKSKLTDINEIARLSNCTYHECIIKIKYLKNKRIIKDCFVDEVNGVIKPCNERDIKLIKKYSPFIYIQHSQIDEIVKSLPYTTFDNYDEVKEEVMNDLKYLDDRNLVNGINIDFVDEKIIYYTIEKRKKEKDYISINCESCGALNDVPRQGKARCEYCNNILEDKSTIKS